MLQPSSNQPLIRVSPLASPIRDALSLRLVAWQDDQGLPLQCANEQLDSDALSVDQRVYLTGFNALWDEIGWIDTLEADITEHLEGLLINKRAGHLLDGVTVELTPIAAIRKLLDQTKLTGGTRRVTVAYDLSDSFLADVLCTALEGGTGYWGKVDITYRGEDGQPTADCPQDGDIVYLSAKFFDTESFVDGEYDGSNAGFQPFICDYELLARGIALILGPEPTDPELAKYWTGHKTGGYVRQAVAENDAGHIDADVADAIVQMGAFGKLVFG